jgi:hypothetical protein
MSQIAFFTRDGDMRGGDPGYRAPSARKDALMGNAHPGYDPRGHAGRIVSKPL